MLWLNLLTLINKLKNDGKWVGQTGAAFNVLRGNVIDQRSARDNINGKLVCFQNSFNRVLEYTIYPDVYGKKTDEAWLKFYGDLFFGMMGLNGGIGPFIVLYKTVSGINDVVDAHDPYTPNNEFIDADVSKIFVNEKVSMRQIRFFSEGSCPILQDSGTIDLKTIDPTKGTLILGGEKIVSRIDVLHINRDNLGEISLEKDFIPTKPRTSVVFSDLDVVEKRCIEIVRMLSPVSNGNHIPKIQPNRFYSPTIDEYKNDLNEKLGYEWVFTTPKPEYTGTLIGIELPKRRFEFVNDRSSKSEEQLFQIGEFKQGREAETGRRNSNYRRSTGAVINFNKLNE